MHLVRSSPHIDHDDCHVKRCKHVTCTLRCCRNGVGNNNGRRITTRSRTTLGSGLERGGNSSVDTNLRCCYQLPLVVPSTTTAWRRVDRSPNCSCLVYRGSPSYMSGAYCLIASRLSGGAPIDAVTVVRRAVDNRMTRRPINRKRVKSE